MKKKLFVLNKVKSWLLLLLLIISGCSNMEIKGKTYKQSYIDPQVITLIEAASRGNVKRVEQLVKSGVDVNAIGDHGTTPLIWVMLSRNHRGVETLLKLGANPNQRFDRSYTPMWFAAGGDDIKLLELLLEYGGDVDVWAEGKSPLVLAALQDRPAHYDLLIDYGADINSTNIVGQTIAGWYVALAYHEELLGLLESGYNFELDSLARRIEMRVVPEAAPQWQWREKVIAKLKQMGVTYPPTPNIRPKLIHTLLDPLERQELEQSERDGRLPPTSRGLEMLVNDRVLEKQATYQENLDYENLFYALEKGYCESPIAFTRWVEDNPVSIDSPQWQWRNKVIEQLKLRFRYPPLRRKTERLTKKYRETLVRLEEEGKLIPESNAAKFLALDRALDKTEQKHN